jgi:3-dehydroquinate synthase
MSVVSQSEMTIKSLLYNYQVTFDDRVGSIGERLAKYSNKVFVIDERVNVLYKNELHQAVDGAPVYFVTADESTKTLTGVEHLLDWLLENRCNRSTTIVGIGGGIIQDLVTFTSNIFYRGSSFVLVPTTLLSMCDSCIGAKCGINYGNFKNQLGVIHAPKGVHIISEFLSTLDDRDVMSGYGEVLKLAVTGSRSAFDHVVAEVKESGLRGPKVLNLIRQSLEIKKVVIEEDEYEKDLRRILNYGHTFGHALEALTNHAIPHGLAVAWGIDVINFIEMNRDENLRTLYLSVHEFIAEYLPFKLSRFPSAEELVEMTRRDKKMSGSVLNLAVPNDFGQLSIRPTQLDAALINLVDQYLKTQNVYA